jgi:predicted O-methyltransferase YrrM
MDTNAQPLDRLYRPGEQFEISAVGLRAWSQSPVFRRLIGVYDRHSNAKRALQSDVALALLYHLIVMRQPERVLEIGTYYAGTAEVLAHALWEARSGHLDTIDPYGAERCPPLIATLPAELRERITFWPDSSAVHFDRTMMRGLLYDMVLVDGNHEFEFARFDLECAARLLRPRGLIVVDNIEIPGPRLATKHFLETHPEWCDVADVVRLIDPDDPLALPIPSVADTKFYLLEAPDHYLVKQAPRSFGQRASDRIEVDGIELDLAAPARGTLHFQVFGRTYGVVEPEEVGCRHRIELQERARTVRLPIPRPLRSVLVGGELPRLIDIVLAFSGEGPLRLSAVPRPYPAKLL